jgi:hypothetical protein
VRHVREQRAERDHHLDAELARQVDDQRREGAPAQVGLDPEQQDGIALEPGDRRVVEGVLRPVDPARAAVDEGDVRPGRLEVEEALRLDLGEALGLPCLGEVTAGERRALAAVVPAAEGGDQERRAKRRPGDDAEFLSDRPSLRSAARTGS